MNTNILTEIYRIHEIMGLKKNLLLEGPTKYIENFFNAIKNKTDEFNDLRKTIVGTGFNTSNTDEFFSKWFDDFARAIDQSEKTELLTKLFVKLNNEATDPDILNKFSKFFLGEEGVNSQKYYEFFMQNFVDSQKNMTEKKVIKMWSELTNDQFSTQIKTIFNDSPFTQSLIEPFIRKQIESYRAGSFRSVVVPKKIPYKLSVEEIEKLNLKITSAGKSAEVFFFTPLKDLYVRNLEQLKDSVEKVNLGFVDALKNAKSGEQPQIINAYALQINRLVNEYTKRIGADYKTFLNDLDIEDDLYNKITNPSETDGYFWAWRQTREGLNVIPAIEKELRLLWDDIRFKGFITKTTTPAGQELNKIKLFENRFVSLLTVGQSSPLQAWFRRFIVNGGLRGPKGFMTFIVKQFFYSNLVSIIFAFGSLFLETVAELVWGSIVGEDGTIFGKEFETEFNQSVADDFWGKVVDLISKNFSDRVENVKDAPYWMAALSLIPGGLATIQEGWIQLLFVNAFGAAERPSTFFDLIGMEKAAGLLTPEEEEAGKDVAPDDGTPVRTDDSPPRVPAENSGTSQIPQDLLDIFPDDEIEHLESNENGIFYFEYPVEKVEEIWKIKYPDGYYPVQKDMFE